MPDPTDTTGAPTPTPAPTPAPAAPAPSAPAPSPAAQPSTTNVSVGYPVSVFKSGVDGVPDILSTPTAVPTSSLPALRDAATASRVNLTEEQS